MAAAISLTTPNWREKMSRQHRFDGEGYECDTFLKGPLSFLFIGGLEHTGRVGGITCAALGSDTVTDDSTPLPEAPCFFGFFFFSLGSQTQ